MVVQNHGVAKCEVSEISGSELVSNQEGLANHPNLSFNQSQVWLECGNDGLHLLSCRGLVAEKDSNVFWLVGVTDGFTVPRQEVSFFEGLCGAAIAVAACQRIQDRLGLVKDRAVVIDEDRDLAHGKLSLRLHLCEFRLGESDVVKWHFGMVKKHANTFGSTSDIKVI